MDHIRSAGIRACLSTILSPVLIEESPRSQGSETEDGRARRRRGNREICSRRIQGVSSGEDSSGIEFSNYASQSRRYGVVVGMHTRTRIVIVGVSLAPYLPAPKPENARTSEDVPSDSFIRRELNAHLLLKHFGAVLRRDEDYRLGFLIFRLLPR
ncbi:hypothetical protein G5I_06636 [Acromyrmex echinatior]|uniref:Uncharacterized protein n=1 Tax=Acromyrmex echinatior TaxID=103372 RepID=F4WLK9_ACREC|nr:hypothetical protein G5I_06636 [Acromyrmex echinatior]